MTWGNQWLTASAFLMSIALAMAELASSAPTSGGVRASIHVLWQPFQSLSALFLDLFACYPALENSTLLVSWM